MKKNNQPMRHKGHLVIVGIGPGSPDHMTVAVQKALASADIVVGYSGYIKYVKFLIGDTPVIDTGMRGEVERVGQAIGEAKKGKRVVLVSSGDAGIYGMAGLALQLMENEKGSGVEVSVLPGVTAASAAGALLGAPLMHDTAIISLSDLLTDPGLIEKRLRLAAEGDFVTVLYNPKSRKRKDLFRKALEHFLACRKPDTPVGLVRSAYREEQQIEIQSLGNLDPDTPLVDMFTIVVIGNSHSYRTGDLMITPRGYEAKMKSQRESQEVVP